MFYIYLWKSLIFFISANRNSLLNFIHYINYQHYIFMQVQLVKFVLSCSVKCPMVNHDGLHKSIMMFIIHEYCLCHHYHIIIKRMVLWPGIMKHGTSSITAVLSTFFIKHTNSIKVWKTDKNDLPLQCPGSIQYLDKARQDPEGYDVNVECQCWLCYRNRHCLALFAADPEK